MNLVRQRKDGSFERRHKGVARHRVGDPRRGADERQLVADDVCRARAGLRRGSATRSTVDWARRDTRVS
jgi:hypothetical protein